MKLITSLLLIFAFSCSLLYVKAQPFACPKGSFLTATGACWPCIYVLPYCLTCDNATICTECIKGKELVNGRCAPITPPVGPPLTNQTVPVNGVCPDGYYIDEAQNLCILCSSVMPNCILCQNATFCLNCTEEYDLVDGKCIPLAAPCAAGQYYNETLDKCLFCNDTIPGCVRCKNASVCLECLPNARLVNGTCFVTTIMPECPSGEVLNETGAVCLKCPDLIPGCIECLNFTTCLRCEEGLVLVNGTCTNITVPVCLPGTFLDVDTQECTNCTEVLPYCVECVNATICTRCLPPAQLVKGECVLENVTCTPGTFFNPLTNECQQCNVTLVNCVECTNATFCTMCVGNGAPINDVCIPLGAEGCEDFEYWDPDRKLCVNCNETLVNCTKCLNSTVCLECAEGLNLVNGLCAAACEPGSFFSTEENKCVLCSEVIPNCTLCDNTTYCLECAEGTTLMNGSCVPILIIAIGPVGLCPNGTYYDPVRTGCVDCGSVLANCVLCLNPTECLECAPGATLRNGVCIPGEIAICPPGTYKDPVTNKCQDCSGAMPNCIRCYNSTYCYRCGDSYWAVNGTCIPISEVPCLPEFYRDPESLACLPCQTAMPFCKLCDSPNVCLECSPGYNLVDGKCVAVSRRRLRGLQEKSCQDGYYWKDDACHKCPHGCMKCEYKDNDVVCHECKEGFDLKDSKCIEKGK